MGSRPKQPSRAPARARVLPDFSQLPERVSPEDMVTTQVVEPPEDPRGGRDTETEFMLRNAGF
ncbi:hypothetical protein SAMN04489867_0439 [Pedococcus dokdonensis]|uniref:Uncharacterized protein n=1 Tax=Pedococcus dokdonensis TaxID=443156 RepID=A0A1H0LYL3_9MICO|nr:hypothetical protein [Pedococcus dokdonensis]SDO73237.1 hypothetical protein SAMN04489867_0439 [Pedococcus dokdonensis]